MRNLILVLTVVGSLLGLVLIQYHLLKVGILLEKQRFDVDVRAVMEQLEEEVEQNDVRQQQLGRLLRQGQEELRSPEQLLPQILHDSLEHFLSERLQREGLRVRFAFAIKKSGESQFLIASPGYEKEALRYDTYRRALRGKISRECHCQLYLILKVDNLLNFLLRRLAYLIIPSVLFILLLVASLLILIFSLKRQKRLDQVKNDFINNLTHELKTPVFSISLISKVMKEAVRSGNLKKLKEHIGLIEKENEQLKGHIDKVLELASMEGGRYELDRKLVNVEAVLQEVVDQFTIKVQQKKGNLSLEFSAESDTANIDVHHFKSAVINLLENAIKYNQQEPVIHVETRSNGEQLFVTIQDNGIGIAPEDQKRIFDKFYRVSSGDLHSIKGFGLGLSYVKQIINAHGGSVAVNSKIGEGSRFMIRLPLQN